MVARKVLKLWLNAEAIQLSFTLGAILGMLAMAVMLTVPKITYLVVTHYAAVIR